MKKCWGVLITILIGMGLILTQEDFFDLFLEFLRSALENIKQIETSMATVIGVLGFVLFIKSKFIDNQFVNKLQTAFGKEKFLKMEVVILRLLDNMNPDQLITKIQLISPLEISMRESLKELQTIIQDKKNPAPLKLSRSANKKIDQQIKELYKLLEKRLEMFYLSKNAAKDKLQELIMPKKKEKYIIADKTLKEEGKKVILDQFQPK